MSSTLLESPAERRGVEADDGERLPCRRENPELFFAESPHDVEVAKALCGGCPVQVECLAGALERRTHWGTVGRAIAGTSAAAPRLRYVRTLPTGSCHPGPKCTAGPPQLEVSARGNDSDKELLDSAGRGDIVNQEFRPHT